MDTGFQFNDWARVAISFEIGASGELFRSSGLTVLFPPLYAGIIGGSVFGSFDG